jgi:nucleoside-diphosphate-sugar epimerase
MLLPSDSILGVQVPSLEHLNESVAQLYNHISQPRTKEVILGVPGTGNWVDVRDTALAHVLALELEQASGQRFILSNGVYTVQKICVPLSLHLPPLRCFPTDKIGIDR